MREEVFQLHVATPPMLHIPSLYKARQDKLNRTFFFLLVLNRLFFPCWCFTDLKILPWQPNKMVAGHKTHKLGRQSSNNHYSQIWFATLVIEKIRFNLFPIISLWELSVTMAIKLKDRLANLAILNCSYPSNIYKMSHTASVVLKELSFKNIPF